jgi:hypothetical protein
MGECASIEVRDFLSYYTQGLTNSREHVYRIHTRPVQCLRCWETFGSDEEHLKHTRAEGMCELKSESISDGIDKAQERRLRSKKRMPSVKTEGDKWRQVYAILFPHDDLLNIPSPCMCALFKHFWICLVSLTSYSLCHSLPQQLTMLG